MMVPCGVAVLCAGLSQALLQLVHLALQALVLLVHLKDKDDNYDIKIKMITTILMMIVIDDGVIDNRLLLQL